MKHKLTKTEIRIITKVIASIEKVNARLPEHIKLANYTGGPVVGDLINYLRGLDQMIKLGEYDDGGQE